MYSSELVRRYPSRWRQHAATDDGTWQVVRTERSMAAATRAGNSRRGTGQGTVSPAPTRGCRTCACESAWAAQCTSARPTSRWRQTCGASTSEGQTPLLYRAARNVLHMGQHLIQLTVQLDAAPLIAGHWFHHPHVLSTVLHVQALLFVAFGDLTVPPLELHHVRRVHASRFQAVPAATTTHDAGEMGSHVPATTRWQAATWSCPRAHVVSRRTWEV